MPSKMTGKITSVNKKGGPKPSIPEKLSLGFIERINI